VNHSFTFVTWSFYLDMKWHWSESLNCKTLIFANCL